MKKYLSILCALAMLSGMVGCSSSKESSESENSSSVTTTTTETTTEKTQKKSNEKRNVEFKTFSISIPADWEEFSMSDDDINFTNEKNDIVLSCEEHYDLGLQDEHFDEFINNLRSKMCDSVRPLNGKSFSIYESIFDGDTFMFDFFINGYWYEFSTPQEYYDEIKEIIDNINIPDANAENGTIASTTKSKTTEKTTKVTTQKATESPTEKVTEPPTEKISEPEVPAVPTEYLNALRKADSYANNQHMSKSKLYNQLTSAYGEHFSEEAANYAIENVITDYNQNALAKADSYANNQHMSKSRLYDQLTSEYGEGFTESEAQYAVDNVATDYNYNALQKAISYQEGQAMSKERIYEQLVSEYGEGFTPEEAQYAVDNLG